VESIPWNRFLGFFKVYEFGLWVRSEKKLNQGSKVLVEVHKKLGQSGCKLKKDYCSSVSLVSERTLIKKEK
jgi:hypothetical protein